MTLQDAGLLFLALFPFTLVGVATVAMIRRRRKKKAKLSLVKIDPAQLKSMNNFNSRMEQLNAEAFRDEALDDSNVRANPPKRKKRKSKRGKRK